MLDMQEYAYAHAYESVHPRDTNTEKYVTLIAVPPSQCYVIRNLPLLFNGRVTCILRG
jgi:hypothetical protein